MSPLNEDFGQPLSYSPPSIKLSPTQAGVVLTFILPDGKQVESTLGEREGIETLIRVLSRHRAMFNTSGVGPAPTKPSPTWVPGAEVRFAPKSGPWRASPYFSENQDFIPVTVIGERSDGMVLCQLASSTPKHSGKVWLNPGDLQHPTRKFTASGKEQFTLADIGL